MYVGEFIMMAISAEVVLEIKEYLKTQFSITELGNAKQFFGNKISAGCK